MAFSGKKHQDTTVPVWAPEPMTEGTPVWRSGAQTVPSFIGAAAAAAAVAEPPRPLPTEEEAFMAPLDMTDAYGAVLRNASGEHLLWPGVSTITVQNGTYIGEEAAGDNLTFLVMDGAGTLQLHGAYRADLNRGVLFAIHEGSEYQIAADPRQNTPLRLLAMHIKEQEAMVMGVRLPGAKPFVRVGPEASRPGGITDFSDSEKKWLANHREPVYNGVGDAIHWHPYELMSGTIQNELLVNLYIESASERNTHLQELVNLPNGKWKNNVNVRKVALHYFVRLAVNAEKRQQGKNTYYEGVMVFLEPKMDEISHALLETRNAYREWIREYVSMGKHKRISDDRAKGLRFTIGTNVDWEQERMALNRQLNK